MNDSTSSPSSSSSASSSPIKEGLLLSLLSGGFAGLSVDVVLFPLDTLKTRLQAADGFIKSGGFKGIYKGLSAAAVGSIPGAALFFGAYDTSKGYLTNTTTVLPTPMIHMTAAGIHFSLFFIFLIHLNFIRYASINIISLSLHDNTILIC